MVRRRAGVGQGVAPASGHSYTAAMTIAAHTPTSAPTVVAFIGGGNMAAALMAGLLRPGRPAAQIHVVEPDADARSRLAARHPGLALHAAAGPALVAAGLVVWAVKPQVFAAAAAPVAVHTAAALHVSVMAGVPCAQLSARLGTARVVRAMPNTPALVGAGMAGLYAPPAVDDADRAQAQAVLASTGAVLWVASEGLMDAVTAISGSGPAYVFYVMEALVQAGVDLGLPPEAARTLVQHTVAGAAALTAQADEPLGQLRARVTSPGGTTEAALTVLAQRSVDAALRDAARAAAQRAQALSR